MDWFNIDHDGHLTPQPVALLWSEESHQRLTQALDEIKVHFVRRWGRLPSVLEVQAGMKAVLEQCDETLPVVPAAAPVATDAQMLVMEQWASKALGPYLPAREEAWRHLRAVLLALEPVREQVPDSPGDLGSL